MTTPFIEITNIMHVLYDCRWIGEHGIGRFSQEVIDALPRGECLNTKAGTLSPLDPIVSSYEIAKKKPDVYFSPGFNPPLWSTRPFVFTIHDLIHLHIPEERNLLKSLYYQLLVRPAVHKAFKVLTVSEFSRSEIVKWSGIHPEEICVVGNGVDEYFVPGGEVHRPRYPYLFNIGNHKPHKNISRLICAFAQSGISPEIRLVLTGKPDSLLNAVIQQSGVADRVVFAGLIPENELPAYYRGAIALVFPSLYEGFGLPIVEAMACSTPVITSNVTAMPEVAGDSALLVDPYSVDDISKAIGQICGDEELRRSLADKGVQRARKFSWDSVALRVKEILGMAFEAGVRGD